MAKLRKTKTENQDSSGTEYLKNYENVVGINLEDGTLYRGSTLDGRPEGHGVIKFLGGTYFKGEFKDGAPNGKGKIRLRTGEIIEGEFVNGIFQGKRRRYFKTYSFQAIIVKGILVNITAESEVPHTKIAIIRNKVNSSIDSSLIDEPDFEFDDYFEKLIPQAIIEEPIGEIDFEEEDSFEKVIPQAIIEEPIGEIDFEEEDSFENASSETTIESFEVESSIKPEVNKHERTWGIKKYPTGNYEGEFLHGKRDGRGRFVGNNGSVYNGDFKNDRPHGHIVMKNLNTGMVFDGEYRNGEMRKGTLKINGMTYIGQFRRGIYHGEGKFIGTDGRILEGTFHWGKYLGPKKVKKSTENKKD